MSNIIGNRINYLRFLQGDITLSELADSIGVSRQTISKLESGASKPNLDTLELVADYFDVSMDYILGKTDNLNPGVIVNKNSPLLSEKIPHLFSPKKASLFSKAS